MAQGLVRPRARAEYGSRRNPPALDGRSGTRALEPTRPRRGPERGPVGAVHAGRSHRPRQGRRRGCRPAPLPDRACSRDPTSSRWRRSTTLSRPTRCGQGGSRERRRERRRPEDPAGSLTRPLWEGRRLIRVHPGPLHFPIVLRQGSAATRQCDRAPLTARRKSSALDGLR